MKNSIFILILATRGAAREKVATHKGPVYGVLLHMNTHFFSICLDTSFTMFENMFAPYFDQNHSGSFNLDKMVQKASKWFRTCLKVFENHHKQNKMVQYECK